MRLRKQLLLLSLITLVLPWVGVQYVREMDAALRQGQVDTLTATARAVAARIASDPQMLAQFQRHSLSAIEHVYYAHSVSSGMLMDGYIEDWELRGFKLETQRNFELALAQDGQKLYAFARVNTLQPRYFNPSSPNIFNSDHFTISLPDGRHIALFVSAPGQLSAVRYSEDGQINARRAEHAVKGIWLESQNGVQLEFSLPLAWVTQGFELRFAQHRQMPEFAPDTQQIFPLLSQSQALSDELEVFASSSLRLYIASQQGKLLAAAGDIEDLTQEDKPHGFLQWLFGFILDNRFESARDAPERQGEFTTADVRQALQGNLDHGWYRDASRAVTRVSYPIRQSNESLLLGAVIAEHNADAYGDITNSVFSRLLGYSLIASFAAALSLVLYATWLSIRIRRLSKAAANAISDTGKVSDHFPTSKSTDEIGELSRSYAQLLSRLREYTNYLRTLSSKLSHELRTPLAIVRTSLDNLEYEDLSPQAKTYAERAKEGALRLSNILNAMSAASRVEQAIGAAELELIPCDMLLSGLKEAYTDVYPKVRFELQVQPHKQGLSLMGSGELIVQMLDKLVDNAADFCPEQGLIALSVARHGDHILFSVRNEGPLLPKHMQNQLFDSMVSVREDRASQDSGHHLGLGLYIVRLITDFHRGEAMCYNAADQSGVIFEVRLPITG